MKAQIEYRKLSALIRKDEYDKIAAELQDLLIGEWDKATGEAIRNVIRAIKGRGEFSDGDLDEMIARLRPLLGNAFGNRVLSSVIELQEQTYVQALGTSAGVAITPTLNLVDRKALAALERNATYPVLHHFDDQLEAKIRQFGAKIIEEGLDRRAAGQLFEAEFSKKYNVESLRYWEGYANNITTRAREMGAVESYVRAELEVVEVRAVLDHRTTEICRHMHGRLIKVSELVRIRDAIIENDDPEKVADITPWPTADELADTPSDALPAGAKMPGYHFGCRTRTRPVRRIAERNVVTGRQMGQRVPRGEQKKLKKYTNQEYSNLLQTIRNRRKIDFTEKDLLHDMAKHASDFGLKTEEAYVNKARSFIRTSDRVLVKTFKGEEQFLFFGENGYTVVDKSLSIRGCFFHAKKDVEQTFTGIGKISLWLKLSSKN